MCLKVLDKLDETEYLLPKFDMTINADGDEEVSFGRGDDIINCFAMHVAEFIEV